MTPAHELSPGVAQVWDAGAMGCGELVLALKQHLDRLSPGDLIQVIASDPGAPEDLPAWCRLTGHVLVESAHPTYVIRRRA